MRPSASATASSSARRRGISGEILDGRASIPQLSADESTKLRFERPAHSAERQAGEHRNDEAAASNAGIRVNRGIQRYVLRATYIGPTKRTDWTFRCNAATDARCNR